MNSIFDTLKSLPLLEGVSSEQMKRVVTSLPLHFLKFPAGDVIFREGAPYTHLNYVISGRVRVTFANYTGRFKVSQTLTGPDVIVPEYLFGRRTTFPCTVEALDVTGILQISKTDYISMLKTDDVMLFNYLNRLAAGSQSRVDSILALTDGLLEERIAYWIVALTQRTGKDIALSCKHKDLYTFFGVQRSVFNNTLQNLAERGIITYTPTEIRPTSREALVKLLLNTNHD